MIGGITFKEDTHQYFDESEVEVPGITTILKSAALIDYRAPGNELFSEDFMLRGKAVHKAIELYNKKTLDENTIDEVVKPYFEAYKKFKKDTGYKSKQSEVLAWHPQRRYATMVDDIGFMGQDPVLLEFKTGAYQPWHRLQVVAGRACLGDEFKTNKDFVLQLNDNATYTLHKVPYEVTEEMLFFSLVNLYYWKKNNNCLKGDKK